MHKLEIPQFHRGDLIFTLLQLISQATYPSLFRGRFCAAFKHSVTLCNEYKLGFLIPEGTLTEKLNEK